MGREKCVAAGMVLIIAVMMTGLPVFASDLSSKYVLLNRSAELTDYIGRYTEASSGKTVACHVFCKFPAPYPDPFTPHP